MHLHIWTLLQRPARAPSPAPPPLATTPPTAPRRRRRPHGARPVALRTAPQAAGVRDGGFGRGCVRAETIAYDDYVACGGEGPAKEAGKMRAEGKEDIVKDGDVLHFRFNV